MSDQLPEAVKKERSRVLIETGKKNQTIYMEQFLQQKKEVLFEEQQEINGASYWVGHTMEYLKLAVLSEKDLENKRENVRLISICEEKGALLVIGSLEK